MAFCGCDTRFILPPIAHAGAREQAQLHVSPRPPDGDSVFLLAHNLIAVVPPEYQMAMYERECEKARSG